MLFPVLKKKGYHLTLNTTERGLEVVRENPYIDKIVIYEDDSVPNAELVPYWEKLAKPYDKFINLSESVEGFLLKAEGKDDFNLPKKVRDRLGKVNYFDRQFQVAGYPEITGRNPEMYYSDLEHRLARKERKKYGDNFVILWSLSGSSMHKSYPYTDYVLLKLLTIHKDISVIFTGDMVCQILFDRKFYQNAGIKDDRVKNTCGHWPIRKSLVMTEYVDLVIGPETGVLNAAGGHDVPKIIMLSHSTHENISKYWKNVQPLFADVPCAPCHQLHYTLESCPLDPILKTPLCMAKLDAKMVYNAIEKVYLRWKDEKAESKTNRRRPA